MAVASVVLGAPHASPAGQPEHTAAEALLYLPAAQAVGVTVPLPAQVKPATQGRHATAFHPGE